jgi:hypothetical protein
MKITSIGIDIGKTTFHLVGLDIHGSIVIRRKFSRKALLAYTVNLPSSLIVIKAGEIISNCRPDTFTQTAFLFPISSCSHADHTMALIVPAAAMSEMGILRQRLPLRLGLALPEHRRSECAANRWAGIIPAPKGASRLVAYYS